MHKIFYILFFAGIFLIFNFLSLGDYHVPFGVEVKEVDEQVTLVEKYNWRGHTTNQYYINEGALDKNLKELTGLVMNESEFKKNFALVVSFLLFLFYFPFSKVLSKKLKMKEGESVLSPFWERFFKLLAVGIFAGVFFYVFMQYPELMEETEKLIEELEPYTEKR